MKGERRWKAVALVASGIAIGTVLVGTPAGAHVASWTHNWQQHIRPKADARYYTKQHVNNRSGRVARANVSGAALGASDATVLSVSLTAPAKGFVWVDADFNVSNGTGCTCSGWFLLRHNNTGLLVPNYKIVSTGGELQSGSLSWVFPVEAGAQTFDLRGHRANGTTLSVDGPTLKAMFVPFGATGGKTLTRPATGVSATATW